MSINVVYSCFTQDGLHADHKEAAAAELVELLSSEASNAISKPAKELTT
jgi:hypothetical protein